jgi:hypothetical protein
MAVTATDIRHPQCYDGCVAKYCGVKHRELMHYPVVPCGARLTRLRREHEADHEREPTNDGRAAGRPAAPSS